MTPPVPNFDPIARPYRWLEYLTLGRALERCRCYFLGQLSNRKRILVLGDGDGRFLTRLLLQDRDHDRNQALEVDAVDTSAAMLALLRRRCESIATRTDTRLRLHHADALAFLSAESPSVRYDLVVTHFFLDCFTPAELDTLTSAIYARLSPGAVWLVSDFRIPPGLMRHPASLFVRALYLAFRILTGLRPMRLPNHAAALTRAGLVCNSSHRFLAGLLTTELWAAPNSCSESHAAVGAVDRSNQAPSCLIM